MLCKLCLGSIVTKKKKATGIHGQWPFQNITKTFVMHVDSLPLSSIFNHLQCLWKKQQLCLYILPCKTEPSLYTTFSSLVFTEKFQMLGTHDGLEQILSLSQHVWTLDWNSSGTLVFYAICRIISLLTPFVCEQWELCGYDEALWNENSESGENITRSHQGRMKHLCGVCSIQDSDHSLFSLFYQKNVQLSQLQATPSDR